MSVLVTGSSGFIGTYLSKHYSKTITMAGFSFLRDNLDNLNLKEIDTVVHLSALVHQMGGASREEYERVNVQQTMALARKAKDSGVSHFIFMSTIKVYGEETRTAYNEQSECHPEDDYGKSKLKAEQELQTLENDGFVISIIRTPIVYGFGVKANIKSLVKLVDKFPVLPFASLRNKRSMVYIGNLCHLVATIIGLKKSGVFLACDDTPLSTTGFIKSIAKALGKTVFLVRIPLFETLLRLVKPSFHKRLYESLEVDNRITKKSLGFSNRFSTEDGLKYMIKGE